MNKSIPVKALLPVFMFFGLVLFIYLLIGGDKANFAIGVFGLPWTIIFEVDPYGNATRAEEMLSFYSGIFINAGIIYVVAVAILLLKRKFRS